MKFRIYHDKGDQVNNPLAIDSASVEEAVAEVERRTGGTAHDAAAFIPELDMWITVDVWSP
jgi:hypothetical protein